MKNIIKKTTTLFILLFASVLLLHAQQTAIPIFINKDSSFLSYLSSNFRFDIPGCEESAFLIRFKINKQGNVVDLAFSKQVTPAVKRNLQNVILSSNNKWKPCVVNNKKIKSQYLVVYIRLSIDNSSCKQQTINDFFYKNDSTSETGIAYKADTSSNKEQFFKKHYKPSACDYKEAKNFLHMENLFEFDDEKNNDTSINHYYMTVKTMNYTFIGSLYFRSDI